MADKEIKKFITSEYLLKQFVNFNKFIINKIYYKKEKGLELEEKLKTIIGDDENTSIRNIIEKMGKMSKVVVKQTDILPDANSKETEYNAIYIVKDKNSIDEKNSYFIYTLNDVNGVKKWICISSPSYIFETEQINFLSAFDRVSKKFSKKQSFICFTSSDYSNTLASFLEDKPKQLYKGVDYNCYNFLTNDFDKCCVFYNKSTGVVYYFKNLSVSEVDPVATEETARYYVDSDLENLNNLANNIQNPEGGFVNVSNN